MHRALFRSAFTVYVSSHDRGRPLALTPLRRLLSGKCTLTLISGTGRHKRISSPPFILS